MGCDIHTMFQAHGVGGWFDIPSNYDNERHYMLFSWLAGVRNRWDIEPISEPRGLPGGFEVDGFMDHYAIYPETAKLNSRGEEDPEVWMGDHSFSWLTAEEILAASAPIVPNSGIISISAYNDWDGVSCPRSFCQAAFGKNVRVASCPGDIVINSHSCKVASHIRVEWKEDLGESLRYFIDEVSRLSGVHGDIRIVFGFDN